MMTYPSMDTVNLFYEILKRDGVEEITENLLLNCKDVRILPILSFFKTFITNMLEDDLIDETDGFSTGFICCLDMFRREINAQESTLDDLIFQIENMVGWTNFLEVENINLKNELDCIKTENIKLKKQIENI